MMFTVSYTNQSKVRITKAYEDMAERIFFSICFCSTIAYARGLITLVICRTLHCISLFCLLFWLVLTSLVRTRVKVYVGGLKCDIARTAQKLFRSQLGLGSFLAFRDSVLDRSQIALCRTPSLDDLRRTLLQFYRKGALALAVS